MKSSLFFCLLFWAFHATSQCPVLNQIHDSVDFEGIYVHYVQQDSQVQVFYGNDEFNRKLPDQLSFGCNTKYIPSIPHPVWRNKDFIGFNRGCGSNCFDTWLVPLNANDSVKEGGQLLIDTIGAIYLSLWRDYDSGKSYMELLNGYTGQTQKWPLPEIWCTIPLEQLHHATGHEKGFLLENDKLTLFLATEKGKRVVEKQYKISW